MYGKTLKCFAAKHFQNTLLSVLPKHSVFFQNTLCFQSVGAIFCSKHFPKDTNFLKNEIGFSNIGDFKKIWNRAIFFFLVRVQHFPPFFPSVFIRHHPPRLISDYLVGKTKSQKKNFANHISTIWLALMPKLKLTIATMEMFSSLENSRMLLGHSDMLNLSTIFVVDVKVVLYL